MKALHEKLKSAAQADLAKQVQAATEAMAKIAHGNVSSFELARLVVGGRTSTLEKQVVGRMVRAAAEKLLEQYSKQQELPLEGEDAPA